MRVNGGGGREKGDQVTCFKPPHRKMTSKGTERAAFGSGKTYAFGLNLRGRRTSTRSKRRKALNEESINRPFGEAWKGRGHGTSKGGKGKTKVGGNTM